MNKQSLALGIFLLKNNSITELEYQKYLNMLGSTPLPSFDIIAASKKSPILSHHDSQKENELKNYEELVEEVEIVFSEQNQKEQLLNIEKNFNSNLEEKERKKKELISSQKKVANLEKELSNRISENKGLFKKYDEQIAKNESLEHELFDLKNLKKENVELQNKLSRHRNKQKTIQEVLKHLTNELIELQKKQKVSATSLKQIIEKELPPQLFSELTRKLLFQFLVRRWLNDEQISFEELLKTIPKSIQKKFHLNYNEFWSTQKQLDDQEVSYYFKTLMEVKKVFQENEIIFDAQNDKHLQIWIDEIILNHGEIIIESFKQQFYKIQDFPLMIEQFNQQDQSEWNELLSKIILLKLKMSMNNASTLFSFFNPNEKK